VPGLELNPPFVPPAFFSPAWEFTNMGATVEVHDLPIVALANGLERVGDFLLR